MSKTILAVVALCMSTAVVAVDTDAYIESSGVAGIDTGYRVKPNTRIAVDFALTTVEGQESGRLFGADYNTSVLKMALGFYVGGDNNSPCFVFGYGDTATGWHGGFVKDANGNYLFLDTNRHIAEYDFPRGRHTYYTDGKAIAWQTDTPDKYTEEATSSITLFSAKKDTAGVERPIKARIYSVKIYEKIEGEYVLVRDFKPCVATGACGMKRGVAVPGFKCAVTGGFIGSVDNYSTFTASANAPSETAESSDMPYVATGAAANKEFIDTRYVPTDKTRCEIDYSLNSVPSGSGWLFSAQGDGAYYGAYIRGGYPGYYYMHNGTDWHKAVASEVALSTDAPRTVVLDYKANEFCVHAGMVTNTLQHVSGAYAVAGKTYTGSIKLGCKYNNVEEFASLKIYGFRIVEDGVKVRDFKPIMIDGTAGLKCALTGEFISYPDNFKTTKKLSCGGRGAVVASPYIQTDKVQKQYFDTGYQPINTTRFEVDFSMVESRGYVFRGQNSAYFGAYFDGKGFGVINSSGSGIWKTGIVPVAEADALGIRRTAVLDNVANVGKLITYGYENGIKESVNNMPATKAGTKVLLSTSGNTTEHASMRIYACRVFEAGNAVHEFYPAVKDGVAGLQDRLSDKFLPVKSNKGSSNPQVYGGAFEPTITPSTTKLCVGKSVVLTATAPGAKSYRWLKNGTPISGGENGSLTVEWRKGCETDTYQAITIATVDGVDGEGEASSAVTVENLMAPFVISVR